MWLLSQWGQAQKWYNQYGNVSCNAVCHLFNQPENSSESINRIDPLSAESWLCQQYFPLTVFHISSCLSWGLLNTLTKEASILQLSELMSKYGS